MPLGLHIYFRSHNISIKMLVVKALRCYYGYPVRFLANFFFLQNNYLDPPKKVRLGLIRVDWRLQKTQIETTQKTQNEPTQTAKNCIWIGCVRIIFLLNCMIWFAVFVLPKPNCNIRKTLIKHMSSRPILIETQ